MTEPAITPELVAKHNLTPEEYAHAVEILGRTPSYTELGIFSVMWSEHCSYKNTKPLLKTFPTKSPKILVGAGEENAGIIDIGDGIAIAFKIESHNHPSAVEPYTYDDHTWAVPLYNMAHSMWYRKSVFAEAGITPPTTWDELLVAVEALTQEGQYGIGLPANKQLYTDQVVYDFMVNAGADEIYNEDGTLRFNNPQTVEAYDFYRQLYQFSPPDSPNWTWGEAEACFANRTCAIIPQFTVITTYDTQAEGDPEDLGVMAIPHSANVDASGTIAYSNAVMLLTEDPAKQAAAQEFLRFLLAPGNYGRFLNMEPGLFLPVTEAGSQDESFWNDPLAVKYQSQLETMVENAKNGRLFGFTNGNTFPSIAAISAQNLVAHTLQLVVIDGMAAADAVAEGQRLMEEALTE